MVEIIITADLKYTQLSWKCYVKIEERLEI